MFPVESSPSTPSTPFLKQQVHNFSDCFSTRFFCTIFTHIEANHLVSTIHNASLTCRKWKALVDDRCFWDIIVANLNSIPVDLNDYYSSITINRMTSQTHKPLFQEIAIDLNLALCQEVHFMNDSFVIGYQQNILYIQSLENTISLNTVNFDANIYSICTLEEMIYCSLDNDAVVCLSANNPTDKSFRVYVDSFSKNAICPEHGFTQVLATDLWLITISNAQLKQWSRHSFHPLVSQDLEAKLTNCQIHNQDLYYSVKNPSGTETIFSKDLNEFQRCTQIQVFESEISHLQFNGNQGFCYSDHKTITEFDLFTKQVPYTYEIDPTSASNFPAFKIFGDLLIVAHSQDPNKMDEKENSSVLEMINLRDGYSSKVHHNYPIHFSKKGGFAFIHETIWIATQHQKIVKVTFPSPFIQQSK